MFRVDDVPQPTLVMLHREMAGCLTEALAAGTYKLYPALRSGADELARRRGLDGRQVLREWAWTSGESPLCGGAGSLPAGPGWSETTPAQEQGLGRYFMNVNTPEEFARRSQHAELLDT